jgi:hypothetical protein
MNSGNDELFRKGKSAANAKRGPESDLADKIRQLQADRQQHAQAISEIDQVLHRVEKALTELKAMTSRTPTGHAQPHAPAAPDITQRPRRHYQKFELTGEESVLDFIRREGHPTTAEINNNWHAQGRTGVANPILARLLKRGLLERESDPTVRGSRYRLSPQPADASR